MIIVYPYLEWKSNQSMKNDNFRIHIPNTSKAAHETDLVIAVNSKNAIKTHLNALYL